MIQEFPTVSIVVPAYNHARYLRQSLDSLLAQTYSNLEILVIDDGSTDATPAILESYAGKLRSLRQDNVGQAATLNRGWNAARGDVLGYLSADDVLDATAVETLVAVLVSEPGIVMVYPDYRLIDVRGEVLKVVKAPEFDDRVMLSTWECAPGPGALFRREAGQVAGFWSTDLKLVPDYAFWLRLSQVGTCCRIPQVLAGFRVHDGSQTFGPVLPERSEEYIQVTMDYFAQADVSPELRRIRQHALSTAYLMSARSHVRSARYRIALRRAATGLRLYPRSFRPRTGKLILHGLLVHRRFGSRTTPSAGDGR